MTYKADEKRVWYLDSFSSRHICNNHEIFVDLCPKRYEFVIACGNIIRLMEVGTVIIFLENSSPTLANVIYVSECDAKLIFLSQF